MRQCFCLMSRAYQSDLLTVRLNFKNVLGNKIQKIFRGDVCYEKLCHASDLMFADGQPD
jgi:hypothetical protein